VTPLRREPRVKAMSTAPAQQPCIKITVFIHQRDRPSDYAGTSELVQKGVTKMWASHRVASASRPEFDCVGPVGTSWSV
jgi:hypothetical protein